jgi:hypothetical protein
MVFNGFLKSSVENIADSTMEHKVIFYAARCGLLIGLKDGPLSARVLRAENNHALPGDLIARVDENSMEGIPIREVLAHIKCAPRPVTITFLKGDAWAPPAPTSEVKPCLSMVLPRLLTCLYL